MSFVVTDAPFSPAGRCRPFRPVLPLLAALLLVTTALASPSDWTAEIDRITAGDKFRNWTNHPVVFVGSSSIRLWMTMQEDFPGMDAVNRGFGGSELADSVYYLDRLVLACQPRTVVLYAGENDISAGKSPEAVAADFDAFCTKLHAALPTAHIFYLAMKPSPLRWTLHEKFERGNDLIAAACARDPRQTFVDVYHAMLGPDGRPRPELYREDRLHMKPAGYVIWIRLLTPLLKP